MTPLRCYSSGVSLEEGSIGCFRTNLQFQLNNSEAVSYVKSIIIQNNMDQNIQDYLESTYYLDYYAKEVANFADSACSSIDSPVDKAVALYYAVRDQIRYDPYLQQFSRPAMRASSVVKKETGFCVTKAILLAATARYHGIPSRLGFADVTNHMSTARLKKLMGTDLFIYHGYTEMLLNDKWVKATPAFNLSLCTRFNVKPLEFDGKENSIFHEFDTLGQKHMEYVRDHGHFSDLPFDRIVTAFDQTYPNFFENIGGEKQSDFATEAVLENGG